MHSTASAEKALAHVIGLFNTGQRAQAEAACAAALQQHGANAALDQLMASLLLERGEAARACEHIERSLRARPGHEPSLRTAARAWLARGIQQREHGDHAASRTSFTRSTEHEPRLLPAWFSLSLACQDLHDEAAAEDALRRALALSPGHVPSLVNLALMLQTRGDLPAALKLYGRALSHDPEAFGRIANALCSEANGLLCLDLEALRQRLLSEAES